MRCEAAMIAANAGEGTPCLYLQASTSGLIILNVFCSRGREMGVFRVEIIELVLNVCFEYEMSYKPLARNCTGVSRILKL